MKNTTNTIIIMLFILISNVSQSQLKSKYNWQVTTDPNGSISIVVYDVKSNDGMVLESALSFYKYEILDELTSVPVFEAENKGYKCVINKDTIPSGDYKLKLYTKEFIITTKVTVFEPGRLASYKEAQIASNDE